jgi:hypothetical protein
VIILVFLPEVASRSRSGSLSPNLDNETRLGISSRRCSNSLGAKVSISSLRWEPEKVLGLVEQVSR